MKKIFFSTITILVIVILSGCDFLLNKRNQTVEPMLNTKWSQSGGSHPNFTYNNATPYVTDTERAFTGCSAVALGQILKYYNYPKRGLAYNRYCSTGQSIYNCWDGEIIEAYFSTKYKWADMTDTLSYDSSSAENIDSVSQLLFHIGVALNTKYGAHGSSAQIENPSIFNAFKKHFRMSNIQMISRSEKTYEEWEEIILSEIMTKRPVVLSGYDSNLGGGHAYVVDGVDNEGKFHINFGWGGAKNDYYHLDNLVIDGTYDFTEDLIAIINITPNVIEIDGSCNGPEGARCKDGLECVNDNQEQIIESESDEYGVCFNP